MGFRGQEIRPHLPARKFDATAVSASGVYAKRHVHSCTIHALFMHCSCALRTALVVIHEVLRHHLREVVVHFFRSSFVYSLPDICCLYNCDSFSVLAQLCQSPSLLSQHVSHTAQSRITLSPHLRSTSPLCSPVTPPSSGAAYSGVCGHCLFVCAVLCVASTTRPPMGTTAHTTRWRVSGGKH